MSPPNLEFSLIRGSPIDRALRRLGLTEPGARLVLCAVVLVAIAWVPLVVLALAQGELGGRPGALLQDYQVHVRFLIAVPALVLAEGVVGPRLTNAIRYLGPSGIVDEDNAEEVERAIDRTTRLRVSYWEPAVVFLAAYALALGEYGVALSQANVRTWRLISTADGHVLSAAAWWYLLVSGPISGVMIFRWLWRLAIWGWLMARLARARLHLTPSHPDGAAGLAPLATAHTSFGLVLFAIGAILASAIANQAHRGERSVLDFKSEVIAFIVLGPALFLAPLLPFTPTLVRTRRACLHSFGARVADHARRFEAAWAHGDEPIPLDCGDMQTNADLGTTFQRTQSMGVFLFLRRDVVAALLAPAAAPMLILAMTEVPLLEILGKIRGLVL